MGYSRLLSPLLSNSRFGRSVDLTEATKLRETNSPSEALSPDGFAVTSCHCLTLNLIPCTPLLGGNTFNLHRQETQFVVLLAINCLGLVS